MRADRKIFLNRLKIVFIFALLSSVIGTYLQAETILIVKTPKFPDQYDKALLGCLQELKDLGYKDKVKVLYMDTSQPASSITEPFDIIYAIGSEAASFAKDTFKDNPIVFSMVLDPVGRKLVQDINNPEGNVTGVSLDVSADEYFQALKKILPRNFTLGIIYDPANSKELVARARLIAPELNIKIIVEEVESSFDVLKSLDSVLPKVDLFWMLLDKTVLTKDTIPLIIERCIQKKVGVCGFSDVTVKAGALCAPIFDCGDIGRQSGEVIIKILAQKDKKKMPRVEFQKIKKIALNTSIADSLGIKIPPGAEQIVIRY